MEITEIINSVASLASVLLLIRQHRKTMALQANINSLRSEIKERPESGQTKEGGRWLGAAPATATPGQWQERRAAFRRVRGMLKGSFDADRFRADRASEREKEEALYAQRFASNRKQGR
jgi:hypothetical protein